MECNPAQVDGRYIEHANHIRFDIVCAVYNGLAEILIHDTHFAFVGNACAVIVGVVFQFFLLFYICANILIAAFNAFTADLMACSTTNATCIACTSCCTTVQQTSVFVVICLTKSVLFFGLL